MSSTTSILGKNFENSIKVADAYLNDQQKGLVNFFENSPIQGIQNEIDQIGLTIDKNIVSLKREIDQSLQVASTLSLRDRIIAHLWKLPLRAIFNALFMIYHLATKILRFVVHPLQSILELSKALLNALLALTKPENWVSIGAGLLGASLGQSLIAGSVFPIVVILSLALIIAGFAVEAIKEANKASENCKEKEASDSLSSQFKKFIVALLEGCCLGMIFGGIQRAHLLKNGPHYHHFLNRRCHFRYPHVGNNGSFRSIC